MSAAGGSDARTAVQVLPLRGHHSDVITVLPVVLPLLEAGSL